ncbi:hypothetical protein FACS189491_07900 [Spirochaetia bacterium]|nr:hypothetical protein FACS189491_07900 [Spirochaetia bacterium]
MRQKFYIYRRKGNPVYFARFKDEAGGTLTERSTGCTVRDEAVLTVGEWLRDGLPPNKRRGNKPRRIATEATLQGILKLIAKADTLDTDSALEIVKTLRERGLIDTPVVKTGPGNVDFTTFLKNFYDFDKSPYVREKLAHGQKLGRRHCQEMLNRIRIYWIPAFQNRKLNDITRKDLKEFSMFLTESRLWGADEGFIFYSLSKPDVPMDGKLLLDCLRDAIEAENRERRGKDPDAELIDWKPRNITFHSHRHYFAARLMDILNVSAPPPKYSQQ